MYKKCEASASGKVLIAGGYLITEAPNVGLVLSVSARMTTTLESAARATPLAAPGFTLHSPQFHFRESYSVSFPVGGGAKIAPEGNPFLLGTLRLLFAFHRAHGPPGFADLFRGHDVCITVVGDDAFYSAPSSAGGVPRKTGLGSSAALVTSLVAAFSAFVEQLPREAEAFRHRVHALAQFAHCACQGKIGSGFDVAAAVFGSQVYSRFAPERVEGAVEALDVGVWAPCRAAALPRNLRLLLGDVAAGAETPGMVRLVAAWLRALPEQERAASPWARLAALNERFVAAFEGLGAGGAEEEQEAKVKAVFAEIRRELKRMGELSGAAIEPDAQTELCDRTQALPGVLLCGVPGAGGMDAVFVICRQDAESTVRARWAEWGVRALPLEEDPRGLLLTIS